MDIRVLIQVLYYIGLKLNRTIDKLTALKLVFFADRYHLRKYFSLITNDQYYAMDYGPVASNVKSLISLEDYSELKDGEKKYFDSFLKLVGNFEYKVINNNIMLNMLSETDIEALDFAINNFGKYSSKTLVDITHKFPEWKRFENSIKAGYKREKIVMEDFFKDSDLKPNPFDTIPNDVVKSSQEIFEEEHIGLTC